MNDCDIIVLYELSKDNTTQSSIVRKYNKTFAAINKAKNRLIELGLVEFKKNRLSKRDKLIGLTQKARELEIPRIVTEFVKMERKIYG